MAKVNREVLEALVSATRERGCNVTSGEVLNRSSAALRYNSDEAKQRAKSEGRAVLDRKAQQKLERLAEDFLQREE